MIEGTLGELTEWSASSDPSINGSYVTPNNMYPLWQTSLIIIVVVVIIIMGIIYDTPCVCMCVCVHACVHTCVYVCVCVFVCFMNAD